MTGATIQVPAHLPGEAWRRLREIGRNAASIALTLVFALVALVASVVAVSTHLSSGGQYKVFGHPVLVVLSGSMTPTFDTGDIVIDSQLTPAEASHLRVGQIITFRDTANPNRVLTHRIVAVKVTPGGAVAYQTKGDANNAPDSDLRPATNVIGLYNARIPRGGYVLSNLHRPLVVGLLLASPLLWFIGAPLRRWARQEEDREAGSPTNVA